MGSLSAAAFDLGEGLGLASCAFTQGLAAQTAGILGTAQHAADFLNQQGIAIPRIADLHSEPDCVQARQDVGGILGRANAVLHDFYQTALHLGLALGQAHAPLPIWRGQAGQLFLSAIHQAMDDLKSPNIGPFGAQYHQEVEALQTALGGPPDTARALLESLLPRMKDTAGRAPTP